MMDRFQIFAERTKKKFVENAEEFGREDPLVLLAVCTEELGEVSRALRKEVSKGHELSNEIIDLAAVLFDLFDQEQERLERKLLEDAKK